MSEKRIPFNMWNRRYIFLNKEEIYCPKCKGRGGVESKRKYEHNENYEKITLARCNRCDGKGKLDWVSQLIDNESSVLSYVLYTRHKNTSRVSEIYMRGEGEFPNKLLDNIKKGGSKK